MSFEPWQLLLSIVAGWIHDEQQKIIEYQRTVIQVLQEKNGKKRILLNDGQRRRLAVKGKVLGRTLLNEIGTLFTPDTILRWHRELVAQKWDHSDKRRTVGRPATPQEVVDRILQLARENPTWGYDRIADALANIGHQVSDQTVGNILKAHGIEPAPERKRTTRGQRFSKRTGTSYRPSISRRLKCGPRTAWSRITCCLPCGWRHTKSVSSAARPTPAVRG